MTFHNYFFNRFSLKNDRKSEKNYFLIIFKLTCKNNLLLVWFLNDYPICPHAVFTQFQVQVHGAVPAKAHSCVALVLAVFSLVHAFECAHLPLFFPKSAWIGSSVLLSCARRFRAFWLPNRAFRGFRCTFDSQILIASSKKPASVQYFGCFILAGSSPTQATDVHHRLL